MGWDLEQDDGAGVKRWLLALLGMVVFIALWLGASQMNDEAISSSGFDGGGGHAGALASREPRGQTSLSFVRRGEVASAPAAAGASAGQAAPAQSPGASTSAAEPPATPAELAKAGIPTDPRGLAALGAKPGLLGALAARLMDHPKILKAVFNNKLVVDAVMARPNARAYCNNPGALTSMLSDPQSKPMTSTLPVIMAGLSKPTTAAALVGTEMATRVLACPAVKSVSSDARAITTIALSNPQVMTVLSDPRASTALASNPQASAMLSGALGAGQR